MKRNESGLYEAKKFICKYNQEIIGLGTTKDEARADLKAQLKKYRSQLPFGISGKIHSPGYEVMQDQDGFQHYVNNPNRTAFTLARKDLAMRLRELRKDQFSDEEMEAISQSEKNEAQPEVESNEEKKP